MNRNEVAEQLRALAYDVERGKADANAILEFASQVQAPGIMFQWTAPENPDEARRISYGVYRPGTARVVRIEEQQITDVIGVLF